MLLFPWSQMLPAHCTRNNFSVLSVAVNSSGVAFFNSKIIFLNHILCLGGLWVGHRAIGFFIVRVHNERVNF